MRINKLGAVVKHYLITAFLIDSNKTSNKRVKTYYLKKILVKVLNKSCTIKKGVVLLIL